MTGRDALFLGLWLAGLGWLWWETGRNRREQAFVEYVEACLRADTPEAWR